MTAPVKTPAKTSWWAENWKPLLVVWGVCLLPFLTTLFSGQVLFSSDQQASPAWRYYFDALRAGEFPLWNVYAHVGMPTFDAMFGDASYPPFILLGFLLPSTHVVSVNFVLHVLIAGFSAFFLARRYFGLTGTVSAAMGVAYALNPHFISYIYGGHTGKFFILAWLPLSLFFLLRALGPAASWKHLLGLSLTVMMFVLGTHLQFTYFVMMGYFVVWLFFLVPALRGKRFREAGSLVLRFWPPLLLGVGLAFFIFYPPMQYTKEFGIRGSAEKTTYEHASSWSLHPEEVASLLVPEFAGIDSFDGPGAGYWGRNPFKINTEAPGAFLWFFGLLGLFAFRTRWFGWWAAVGVIATLYGLAAHTPLHRLFYDFVPGITNFRAASMMLFWLGIALLAMSGETLRRLLAGDFADREKFARGLLYGAGGAVAALLLAGFFPEAVYSAWNGVMGATDNFSKQAAAAPVFGLGALRVAAIVAVLAYATSAFLVKSKKPLAFGLVIFAAAMVDNYWVDSHFIKGSAPAQGLASEPAIDYIKADKDRFRVYDLPGVLPKGYAMYHAFESLGGWTDNEMRHYRALRGGDYSRDPYFLENLVQRPDGAVEGNRILDLLNVKYLAFRTQQNPGVSLAINATMLPRAFFVPSWQVVGEEQALQNLRAPGFDPKRVAYVSNAGASSGGAMPDSGSPLVVASEEVRENNRHSYRVNAPSRGVLFVSELWFPHWRVTVDGKPAELLRVNYAFRGAFVDAGEHLVEFEYHSPWLRRGFQMAALSVVVLALYLWAFAFVSRRAARKAA